MGPRGMALGQRAIRKNPGGTLSHALYTAEMLRVDMEQGAPFSFFYSLYETGERDHQYCSAHVVDHKTWARSRI